MLRAEARASLRRCATSFSRVRDAAKCLTTNNPITLRANSQPQVRPVFGDGLMPSDSEITSFECPWIIGDRGVTPGGERSCSLGVSTTRGETPCHRSSSAAASKHAYKLAGPETPATRQALRIEAWSLGEKSEKSGGPEDRRKSAICSVRHAYKLAGPERPASSTGTPHRGLLTR